MSKQSVLTLDVLEQLASSMETERREKERQEDQLLIRLLLDGQTPEQIERQFYRAVPLREPTTLNWEYWWINGLMRRCRDFAERIARVQSAAT